MIIYLFFDERLKTESSSVVSFICCAINNNIAEFVIETSFGIWAGWRGYNIVSSQNNDSFEAIAQIPLVAGRR